MSKDCNRGSFSSFTLDVDAVVSLDEETVDLVRTVYGHHTATRVLFGKHTFAWTNPILCHRYRFFSSLAEDLRHRCSLESVRHMLHIC